MCADIGSASTSSMRAPKALSSALNPGGEPDKSVDVVVVT
jgi:hypothetical protein